MLCYRDMTFCAAYPNRCVNRTCPRAFTTWHAERAQKWWGGPDAPVAYSDFEPNCDHAIKPGRETTA